MSFFQRKYSKNHSLKILTPYRMLKVPTLKVPALIVTTIALPHLHCVVCLSLLVIMVSLEARIHLNKLTIEQGAVGIGLRNDISAGNILSREIDKLISTHRQCRLRLLRLSRH